MRTVRYKVLPPINPFNDPVPHTHSSLVEFLFAMPYLYPMAWGAIPSLSALNEIFLTGLYDAGMSGGCEWKPFQIDAQEYEELVLELLTWPGKKFYVPEPPKVIKPYVKKQAKET